MKILMVCLGNICRSPLAEGVLRDKIQKSNLGWSTDSAGTGTYHTGEPPHILSQKIARLHGFDISDLRARQFAKTDMVLFDKIYVMDTENYADVKRMSQEMWNENKVEMIMNELYPHENRIVPDPWFGKEKDFENVYQMLDKTCERIVKKAVSNQL